MTGQPLLSLRNLSVSFGRGARQVEAAEVALSTAQPGYVAGCTSALILRRDA